MVLCDDCERISNQMTSKKEAQICVIFPSELPSNVQY